MILILKKILKYIFYNLEALFLFVFKNSKFETNRSSSLFITHNLGGGTENYIKSNDFSCFIFLRKIGYGKDCFYEITEKSRTKYILKKDLKPEISRYNSFFVNSLVSFSEKENILRLLIKEKETRMCKIVYAIHDFDCICKNNFNIIKNEFFCALNCNKCKKLDSEYCSVWNQFLSVCDEIRCFSESSKSLILEKYKNIDAEKISVLPHRIDYCKKFTPIELDKKELHIGFVGNCNTIAKGRNIVTLFLKFAKKKSIKISVIGKFNIKNKVFSKYINYTGKYNQSDLPEILKKENVNIIFFSSVCPETFSYLISELISLELPICAFDIGAQGEKLKNYKLGCLLEFDSVENTFLQIEKFWKSIK